MCVRQIFPNVEKSIQAGGGVISTGYTEQYTRRRSPPGGVQAGKAQGIGVVVTQIVGRQRASCIKNL